MSFIESMEALIMCGCPRCSPRKLTPDDLRRQEADILRYKKGLARDEARRNERPPQPEAKPDTLGCVFAKSCSLPDGLINHSNPGGFIPVESLTQYVAFAVLGSGSATTAAGTPLAWIGGSNSATALTSRLGGTLAMAPPELNILAAVLMPNTNLPDSALYTLHQYATLTTAKTRVRVNLERLPDDSVRAYGFYTGKNKDWENVPVVAATADGERFVAELGQGIKLIWTPACDPSATAKIPVLNDASPLPPVWVYPPTDTANKILVNPVHPPEYQDAIVWFPQTDIPPFYIAFSVRKAQKSCSHPDMMEELASYIAGEMNHNINHPSVLKMRKLNSYDTAIETKKYMDLPWYAMAGATIPQTIANANATAALALWTERVGQNRPWDHKPKIRALFGGDVRHKQGAYDYFYDIWSNIHYGYVGMASGLSESVLLDGAGGEQIVSDLVRKVEELIFVPEENRKLLGPHRSTDIDGLRAWDDAPDRISISIGTKLYGQHPNGGITAKMIMAEVLAVTPEKWGEGARAHKCKRN